jgi:hypothetical protein
MTTTAPLLAISSAAEDDNRVGPIIEAVLLQLLKQDRERVFFYPYTDSRPRTAASYSAQLNNDLYRSASVFVLFDSRFYNRDLQKDRSDFLTNECNIFKERIGDPGLQLYDFDPGISAFNSETSQLLPRAKITERQIAHTARKILTLLHEAGDIAVKDDELKWMQPIWTPGLDELSNGQQKTNALCAVLSDSVVACTAFACQNGKWQAVARALNDAVHAFSNGIDFPDLYRGVLHEFFRTSGGLGVSLEGVDLSDEPSLLGRDNSVDYFRDRRDDGPLWRSKARLALLTELVTDRDSMDRHGL